MARYLGDKEVADFLIKEEGFLDKPTDIGDGKITLGSGLTDPKWHALYKKKGKWSKEDNRNAVLEEVAKRRVWAEDTIPNWEQLPESAQDALLSYKYNYNFTPTNSPNLFEAMREGNFFKVAEEINATSKDPKFRKGLEERRKREQEMFLSDLMPQKTSNHSVYVPYTNNVASDNTRVTRYPTREEFSQFRTIVPEKNYVETTTISPGEQRAQQLRNTFESTRDYNRMMQNISIQNNPQPTFTPQYNYHSDGGSLNSKTWDNLSMAEKSEMMRVAIENGITTLPEIRKAYNEFAKGGYTPSKAIKDRISGYEGKAMTGAKDPVTGKWGKNSSFESEAARFYNVLPDSIRNQVLSNPELADNLYSYSYNVGAGNFKKRVVPALERYYAGEGNIKDIENSMWASNDAKLRGLQRRRAEEKEGVRNALLGEVIPSLPTEQELPVFMPSNSQAFFTPIESYQRPVVVEEPLVQAAMENPYSPEQLEREERQRGLNNLSFLLGMTSPQGSDNSFASTIGMLANSQFAGGGNLFDSGGSEVTAFTPIENPIIPKIEGDQEAVNWLANWYNNRREQMYNNLKDYDTLQTYAYNTKDMLTGTPIGRRAINHDFYSKFNNMARFKTATFNDLADDNYATYEVAKNKYFGFTVPETMKIYYDFPLMQEAARIQNRNEGYSPEAIRIHERTHSSGRTGDNGKYTGYNVQTAALSNILKRKEGVQADEYLDATPEIYGRMMEFRYNHQMDPNKKYTSKEIQKMLNQEKSNFNSELQRYDLESLTRAFNEVAQNESYQNNLFNNGYI